MAQIEKRILGISGSPRAGGNSETLLGGFLQGAETAGVKTESVLLRNYTVNPCVGCERCRRDKACTRFFDGMQLLYPKIEAAAGLVLACPTHHYNITAWMKAFIDRLYCYYDFSEQRPGPYSTRLADQGRKAYVIAVCEQDDIDEMGFTLEAMERPLAVLGYEITGKFPVTGHFAVNAVRKNEAIQEEAHRRGYAFAQSLQA